MKKLLRLLLIREDEKVTVFYFLSFFFIVGCGMAAGKASAEALFFKRYGIEHLPVMYAALGIVLAMLSLVYAAFADRISAEKFFLRLFLILSILLVACWLLINQFNFDIIYPLYFLVYEAASEIFIIHSAIYISQNLDSFKSKRLSPVMLAGTQVGLIMGGIMVAVLAPIIGSDKMILIWCILLLSGASMILVWHRKKGRSAYFFKQQSTLSISDSVNHIKQGLYFSKQSSLLSASLLAFFFLVITFYTLHFVTNQIYTEHFDSEESLTAFFGLLTAVTSMLGLGFQLFITNRAIKKFGIQKLNLAFPSAISFSFLLLLFSFSLPAAIVASLVKDTLNPALNSPVRNLILNILPKNIQGRIRAVQIGIVLPVALIICAAILLLAQSSQNIWHYLLPGLIASCLMLLLSFRVSRLYLSTLIQHLKEQVFLPENCMRASHSDVLLNEFSEHINDQHRDSKLLIDYAIILVQTHPDQLKEIINEKLMSLDHATASQLIKIISTSSLAPAIQYLEKIDQQNNAATDVSLKASLLQLLFEHRHADSIKYIDEAIKHEELEIAATGIFGAFKLHHHQLEAYQRWLDIMRSNDIQRSAFLPLIRFLSDDKQFTPLVNCYHDLFSQLINSGSSSDILHLLDALKDTDITLNDELINQLVNLQTHNKPLIRERLVECIHLFSHPVRMGILINALDDGHASVRNQAVNSLISQDQYPDHVADNWLIQPNHLTPRAQQALLQHLLQHRLSTKCLESLADAVIDRSRHFYDALQLLKKSRNNSSANYLVVTTIQERIQQTLQLLLLLLEHIEQTDLVSVAQAAINSHDKLLIATASEALKNLEHAKASDLLLDILQDDFELKSHYILAFTSQTEALHWCKQQDEWLNCCASQALNYA